MKQHTYATEAELCADFMKWARSRDYRVFPETAGFDIVIVDKDGFQTGVEAKKRMNLDVIAQVLRGVSSLEYRDQGPDHRAILVPSDRGMGDVLGMVGVSVFTPGGDVYGGITQFYRRDGWGFGQPFDWNPARRLDLPPVEFEGEAGVPSPSGMTQWKQRALRLCAILEVRGFLTRADFKHTGVSPTRWMSFDRWLVPGAERGQWIRGELPRFEEQAPEVYAAILAEVRATIPANDNKSEAVA